jgi:hypothetical protein
MTDTARAYRAWLDVKNRLRSEMNPRDFNHFVRPMMLLTVLSGSYMLLSLPPNHRIAERARNFAKHGPLLAYLQAQGFTLAGFTAYPPDEVLVALAERFPEVFAQLSGKLRARAEAAAAQLAAEDARDRMAA